MDFSELLGMDSLKKLPSIQLTTEQQDAVNASLPTVVLSCAGTGKTTTMIERVVKAVEKDGISLDDIFITTFSKHAADDMHKRLIKRFEDAPEYIGTFHKNCFKLMKKYPYLLESHEGYKLKKLKMLSTPDAEKIIKKLINQKKAYDTDGKEVDFDLVKESNSKLSDITEIIKQLIDKLKGKGIYPIDYHGYNVEQTFTEQKEKIKEIVINELKEFKELYEKNKLDLLNSFALIFIGYQEKLKESISFDYNDVIALPVFAMRDKQIRSKIATRFKLVVVDEFQDCSLLQFELAEQLSNNNSCSYYVGDEDQLLYEWRDADINKVLSFYDPNRGFNLRLLQGNFRSTEPIINLAVKIISDNKQRYDKTMNVQRTDVINPLPVMFTQPYDDMFEGFFVAKTIKGMLAGKLKLGEIKAKDIAIIFANRYYKRSIEKALRKEEIDYNFVKGYGFYEYPEVKQVLAFLFLASDYDNDAAFETAFLTITGNGGKSLNTVKNRAKEIDKEKNSSTEDDGISLFRTLQNMYDYSYKQLKASMPSTNSDEDQRTISKDERFKELLNVNSNFSAEANKKLPNPKNNIDFITIVEELKKLMKNDRTVTEVIGYIDSKLDFFKQVQNKSGYREAIERVSNIKNLEIALGEIKDEYPEWKDTIDVMADEIYSTPKETIENKVQIMTAYASKGLEFKAVFIIGAVNGMFPANKSSDIEAERRVFYVACTRAKEFLLISSPRYCDRYGTLLQSMPTIFLSGLGEYYEAMELKGTELYNEYFDKNGVKVPQKGQFFYTGSIK